MRDDWVTRRLGDVLEQVHRRVSTAEQDVIPFAGVHWYASGVYKRRESDAAAVKTLTLNRLVLDDITYNRMWATKAAFGVAGPEAEGCLVTTDFPIFRAAGNLLPAFMSLVFQQSGFQKTAAALATGTTERRRLKEKDFLAISVKLPPLDEQQRIVDLIAAVDEAIEAAELLSERLQIVPDAMLREASVDVELVPLGQAVTLARAGGTPSRKRPELYRGDVPWLKSAEVNNPWIERTEESITEEAIRASSAWLVPTGAIVVAMYGATAGQVGRLAKPMATNQAVLALLCEDSVDNGFLFHWLRSRSDSMKSRAVGAAQPNLSKERVLEELVPLLPTERQREVASVLDAAVSFRTALGATAKRLRDLRSALLDDLLSGDHEIPAAYDELLSA